MERLTVSQERVLSFIIACQKNHGSPPTIREIALHFGYRSLNNVRQHLRLIERKGYIRLIQGKARGVEVVVGLDMDSGGRGIQVPLVGSVPAGKPITAIENREDSITLDQNLFKGPGLFTLRVQGESMSGIGILDGDIAIIRQQQAAESGDIVVALIDGEATLKRYIQQNGSIIFRAENPGFSDITIPADQGEVTIAGKLIGIIRKV
ncbi:MAG: transcriptional repressor LexA [bacterium]